MRSLTPEQNAREKGRDCALEYTGPKSQEDFDDRRDKFRSRIIRDYESGATCSICEAGTPREEFLQLLAEWGRGFDCTVRIILGSPEERAAEVRRIAGRAIALAELLARPNLAEDRAGLRTCYNIADDIVSDLDVLLGGAE